MTHEEAVLLDALKMAGLERVTTWDLLCLQAFRTQLDRLIAERRTYLPRNFLHSRLQHDLVCGSLEECWVSAQWDDAEWTASRSNRNFRRELEGVFP